MRGSEGERKRIARLGGKLAGGLMLAAALWPAPAAAEEEAVKIPPPTLDEQAGSATGRALFAGGCFWGVQGVFQHVRGVRRAVSGYAGGDKVTALYEAVGTGLTGHAETVEITYDPKEISYGRLLQVFFSVAHNPTQLNYQGPDHGSQYRSAIFPASDEQRRVAESYIAALERAKLYPGKIVTTLEGAKPFYPAEDYHQDFLTRNPTYPYIVYYDLPKIENLKRLFPELYQEKPALVLAGKS
jgi:peptide-methionine (S)-S-oxide reductase